MYISDRDIRKQHAADLSNEQQTALNFSDKMDISNVRNVFDYLI